jgi:phosphoribosylformylglycinamidine (FGAM) synthase-like enzyme
MAQLVRCCEALKEVCIAYDIPLISGKDSMKNDYKIGDTKISIPPTVLFTAAAILDDATKRRLHGREAPGDVVYVLGETATNSAAANTSRCRASWATRPRGRSRAPARAMKRLHQAIAAGLVASCHDCSDGGLGAALAESAFAGGFGMRRRPRAPRAQNNDRRPLQRSQSRFVATVSPEHRRPSRRPDGSATASAIGDRGPTASTCAPGGEGPWMLSPIAELKEAWQAPLRY